jgi:hypothetical protein
MALRAAKGDEAARCITGCELPCRDRQGADAGSDFNRVVRAEIPKPFTRHISVYLQRHNTKDP